LGELSLAAKLLISPESHESLGDNINGPSLMKVPDWIQNPLGKYYLYFANHQGRYIRLAYSNQVMGPYHIHVPGVLPITQSGFPSQPLKLDEITNESILGYIEKYNAEIMLPFFPPHVASPDVHIHEDTKEIWMYYHGQIKNGDQLTKVAKSKDGLSFTPEPDYLGQNYFRVFLHKDYYYALSHAGGVINRSQDGVHFEAGPAIGDPNMRHTAIRRVSDHQIKVYWSRSGDEPEHILVSDINVSGDWTTWKLANTLSMRRPEFEWEGADLNIGPSRSGFAMTELHELRDPGIYVESDHCYLLYSVKGESGIGICEI
jgi:hypothetical protein